MSDLSRTVSSSLATRYLEAGERVAGTGCAAKRRAVLGEAVFRLETVSAILCFT